MVCFVLGRESHNLDFDGAELKSELAEEHVFEQGTQICFRLYDVLIHDFDVDFEANAVFVAHKRDFFALYALDLLTGLFDEFRHDVCRHSYATALFLTKRDFFHHVAVDKYKHQRYHRKHEIEYCERDDKTLHEFTFEFGCFDSAECRDDKHHDKDDCHNDRARRKYFFEILFHKFTSLQSLFALLFI